MGDKWRRTMWKGTIRYMAYHVIYTDRIHANILCRLRFTVVKAVAGIKHCPISPGYCPSCKYRCLQRSGIYVQARDAWAKHGTYISLLPKER